MLNISHNTILFLSRALFLDTLGKRTTVTSGSETLNNIKYRLNKLDGSERFEGMKLENLKTPNQGHGTNTCGSFACMFIDEIIQCITSNPNDIYDGIKTHFSGMNRNEARKKVTDFKQKIRDKMPQMKK